MTYENSSGYPSTTAVLATAPAEQPLLQAQHLRGYFLVLSSSGPSLCQVTLRSQRELSVQRPMFAHASAKVESKTTEQSRTHFLKQFSSKGKGLKRSKLASQRKIYLVTLSTWFSERFKVNEISWIVRMSLNMIWTHIEVWPKLTILELWHIRNFDFSSPTLSLDRRQISPCN